MNKLTLLTYLALVPCSYLLCPMPAVLSTPRLGLPGSRYGQGYRCPSCIEPGQTTQILMIPQNNILLTSRKSPTLLFYLPPFNERKTIELMIKDEEGGETTTLSAHSDQTSGIVLLDLSALDIPVELEADKNYVFYLSIICQIGEQGKNISARGNIQYEPDSHDVYISHFPESKVSQALHLHSLGLWSDVLSDVAMLKLQGIGGFDTDKVWEELLNEESLGLLMEEEVTSLNFVR